MRGGYAEGCRRRSPALRRGLLYAEGGRRRSVAYAEGAATPTAHVAGWPGRGLRRRPRLFAVGVEDGRRRLAPFL